MDTQSRNTAAIEQSDDRGERQGFFQRKFVQPIVTLLKQGVTPEKMALCLALGVAFGVFPALGWTTALCTVIALVLRLNLPAIQIANYFMYPFQIALLLPFFRLGEKLFGAEHLPLSVLQIRALIHAGPSHAIHILWTTTWHAIVAWALVMPVFVALLYAILFPILRRVLQKLHVHSSEVT
jgi:uncharacterized protein (DUF2062 family)